MLEIEVRGEKDCTGDFPVDSRGMLNFCYVGSVKASGMSPSDLEGFLRDQLAKDFLVNPVVIVRTKAAALQQDSVRVLGAVNRPGVYPLKPGYTILDAILDAGGFSEFASPNRTRLVRGEGDAKRIIRVRMKDLMDSGDRAKDESLQAGDMVVVPEAVF